MRLGSLMRVSEYWGGGSRVMLRWRSDGGRRGGRWRSDFLILKKWVEKFGVKGWNDVYLQKPRRVILGMRKHRRMRGVWA